MRSWTPLSCQTFAANASSFSSFMRSPTNLADFLRTLADTRADQGLSSLTA